MADFETLVVRIVGDSSGFERAMSRSSAAAASMGSKMRSVGRGMSTYVSLPLAAAGAASVKMASDFEQSITNAVSVTGLAGKAAAQARTQMNNLALQLGADTAFSAKEAADAMYDLASSGWNTQQMAKGLPGIMNLAAATQADLATTTGVVTSALSTFGLKASDSGRVADVMTRSISATRLTMDDFVFGMKYIGPVAESVGMSLEETAAAMGVLADNGIKGQKAGTALRGAIGSLADLSDPARAAIEGLGLSVSQVNPETNKFSDIVDRLGKAGMTASDAYKIFGNEGASSMLALTKAGGPALDSLTQKLEESGGAAEKTAKMQLDTLAGSMERLKGAASTMAIQVGQSLTPVIRGLADGLEIIVDAFTKLPAPVRTGIVVFAALAAAAGPLIWIAGSIASAWAALAGISAVATAFSAVGAAIAGALSIGFLPLVAIAAAVVGAGVLIWKFWKPITSLFKTVGSAVGAAVGAIVGAVMRVTAPIRAAIRGGIGAAFVWLQNQVGNVVSWFQGNLPLMRRTASVVFGGIGGDARRVFGAIKAIVAAGVNAAAFVIRQAWGAIAEFWRATFQRMQAITKSSWTIIKTIIGTTVRILGNLIRLGMQVITGDWRGAWNTVKRIGELAWGAIKTVVRESVKIVGNVMKIGWNAMQTVARVAWNLIKNGILTRLQDTANGIRNRLEEMRTNWGNRIEDMRRGAIARFEEIKSGITSRVDDARRNVLNLIDRMRSGAADLWDKMMGGARSFGDGFKNIVVSAISGAVNLMRSWLGSAAHGLASLLEVLGVGPAGELRDIGTNLKSPLKFARGGIAMGDRPYFAGEQGEKEAIVNLERRTPESQRAAAAVLASPNAPRDILDTPGGRARHQGHGADAYGSTMPISTLIPEMQAIAKKVLGRFKGLTANTYSNHPPGFSQPFHRERSVDFWGSGGRGDPIGGVWPEVANYAKQLAGEAVNWVLHPGNDAAHAGRNAHVHMTAFAGSGKGKGTGGSIIDVAAEWAKFVGNLAAFPSGGVMEMFSGLGGKAIGWMKDAVWEWAKSLLSGGSAPAASGDHMQWHTEGLRYSGAFPVNPINIGKLHDLAMKESTDNPNAKNPSGASGLMQMMPSTFDAYKVNSGDSIMNPIHNTAASARYQKDRYGGLTTQSPYGRGGIIPGPLGKKLLVMAHAGERVLPIETTRAFDRLADSINMWGHKRGSVGNPNLDRMGDKIEARLDNVVERLDRQLGKMATKDELADVHVKANAAFQFSKGMEKIEDLKGARRIRRIKDLAGV